MTDAEAWSDGHPQEVEDVDGEQSQPASDRTLQPGSPNGVSGLVSVDSRETSFNSTTTDHTLEGDPPPIDATSTNAEQRESQANGHASPEPVTTEVNGTTAEIDDAMDIAESGEPPNPAQGNSDTPQVMGEPASNSAEAEAAPSSESQATRHSPEPPTPAASSEHDESVDNDDHSTSDSSSETDENAPTRAEFAEDTSTPDEEELKEIESAPERLGNDRK